MPRSHIALAVLAALIWGATFPVTKVALDAVPPLFFAGLRFLLAAAFVVIVPKPDIPWRHILLAGVLLGAAQFGFLFLGMANGAAPGMASLLVHTQAFLTVLIAMAVYGERLTRQHVFAGVLMIAGLVTLLTDRGEGLSAIGVAFVLAAALGGAAGNNVLKGLGKVDMLRVAVWMSLVPVLPMFALSAIFEGPGAGYENLMQHTLAIDWTVIAAAVYSAVLATVLAFAIWGRLLADHPASSVAPFFLLVPVFGISLSVLLLGELLTPLRIAGAAMVLGGIGLSTIRPRRTAVVPRA